MDKKRALFLISFLLVIFAINLANAEIFLSQQPKETYSLGDKLDAVIGTDGSDGWLNVDLVCGNSPKMVYFQYLTSQETTANIGIPITKEFLRDLKGQCFLHSVFNANVIDSLTFTITDKINFEMA